MNNPEVSVVMGVYNGDGTLVETIDSILAQEGVSFEFVIVNDGSTDSTQNILEQYAQRDHRLKVLNQKNSGLTKALIHGCEAAKGRFIARQDAGDISLPDRLFEQLNCIRQSAAAFVSCGTRFVGPNGEHLYDIHHDPSEATERLLTLDLKHVRGPSSHPSTIFSRDLYQHVGGYRDAFYFAQDLDLWIRFAEQGKHLIMPDVLYQTTISVASVSGLYRKEQIQTAELILKCAELRRKGMDETRALRKAQLIRPQKKIDQSRLRRARSLYFIGTCLKKQRHPGASAYFKEALQAFPFHLRSWFRLLAN